MIKKMISMSILASFFAFTACNNDDDTTIGDTTMELNISGLEDLGNDFVYEGWIIVNDTPVTTGVFEVDGNGNLSRTTFSVPANLLGAATTFVLTIEPADDPDPGPSNVRILSGNFNGDTAAINTGIIGDLENVSGTFFLRTPTDETGTNNGNDEYGVWFGTPGMPPAPSLQVPELPEGWIYEGWVVVNGSGPISTGTFRETDSADNDSTFSGIYPGPPIPGEDFFNNAPEGFTFPLDIRQQTIVISIEPVPDNSPVPFLLKPLVGTAGDATAPATHNLNADPDSLPEGTVSR